MSDPPKSNIPASERAYSAVKYFTAENELLTILFTDLVDSTRQQSELGNDEAARLTEIHRAIARELIASSDAQEIDWAGDSCLAVFKMPSEGIAFALRLLAEHRRIRETESNLPDVRIGLHLGEILVKKERDGKDLFGLQVSEASRVMSLAAGNQIYCMRAMFDNARNALTGAQIAGVGPLCWKIHGSYMLKGSEHPVEICEVGEKEHAPLTSPEPNEKCRPVSGSADVAASKPFFSRATAGILVLLLCVLAAASFFALYAPPATDQDTARDRSTEDIAPNDRPRASRVEMSLSSDLPLQAPGAVPTPLAISPDGSMFAYLART